MRGKESSQVGEKTYFMDSGIFELVLIIVIENYAVLINEAHYWSDPARAAEEIHYDIEEPVLR